MRYIGTIFGSFILLAILPFILQEPENFEPEECEVIEYRWMQMGMIQVSEYDTCTMEFSRPIPKCYE